VPFQQGSAHCTGVTLDPTLNSYPLSWEMTICSALSLQIVYLSKPSDF
jgi:hypothetical protein